MLRTKSLILILTILIVGVILSLSYPYLLPHQSKAASSHNTEESNNTTINSKYTQTFSQILIPPPTVGCIPPYYQINSNITNITGLTIYNFSGLSDFVIAPGNTGTISYIINIGGGPNIAAQSDNESLNSNIINLAQLYNATSMTNQTSNGVATYVWTWNSVMPSSFGINISYLPSTEVLTYNGIIPVNAIISVGSNAPEGTYWINLSPGPCNGGLTTLLTVGTNQFNGIVNQYRGST